MKNDVLKGAALAAALVATASAEYELARAVGFNEWVAAAVPGALDIYTVRAMRAHKDVLAAVVAMILVNAGSHLVTAGLLPVNVPLVVAVSAIAPLVLWRVHALRVEEVATTDTLVEYVEPVEVERVPAEPETYPALPEPVPAVPEAVPAGVKLLPIVARPKPQQYRLDSFREQMVPVEQPPVLAAEEPRTRVEVQAEYVPDEAEEPEYPDPLIPQVRADFPGEVPGVRRLKEAYSIGQPRAQRIRDELMGVSS